MIVKRIKGKLGFGILMILLRWRQCDQELSVIMFIICRDQIHKKKGNRSEQILLQLFR
jgi:hypothetical protein